MLQGTLYISLLIAIAFIQACTYYPAEIAQQATLYSGVSDNIVITRQRHFVLPMTSHAAVVLPSANDKQQESIIFRQLIADTSFDIFSASFSKVSILLSANQTPVEVDYQFIITLLNPQERGTEANFMKAIEPRTTDDGRPQLSLGVLSKPYRTDYRVVVMDSRSNKVMDVLQVRARSGAIHPRSYKAFLQRSLIRVTRKLTNSQTVALITYLDN